MTLSALLYAAPYATPPSFSGQEKINVTVTIEPLAEFVEKVGGNRVKVSTLIPPGASPHTYEPKPSQMTALSNADALVKVGTDIEFEINWVNKLQRLNRAVEVIDCSKGIKLITPEPDNGASGASSHKKGIRGGEPHIWLSPRNAIKMVENIYEGLAEIDPSSRGYYEKNKDAYQEKLSRLDAYIRTRLSDGRTRGFIVFHPSWTYFAREYGLEQVSIERRGRKPTTKQMIRVIRRAKKMGIGVVIASPEFNRSSAEAVAKAVGGRVVLISPLARDYVTNLKRLTLAISPVISPVISPGVGEGA